MGAKSSTLKKEDGKFRRPVEDNNKTNSSFNGGIDQPLPKELLENNQGSSNNLSETQSRRGRDDYDPDKHSDTQCALPEAQTLFDTQLKQPPSILHDTLAANFDEDNL